MVHLTQTTTDWSDSVPRKQLGLIVKKEVFTTKIYKSSSCSGKKYRRTCIKRSIPVKISKGGREKKSNHNFS